MTTEIAVPEKQEIEQKLQTLSERALAIKVTDDASLLIADAVKSECLAMRKTVVDFFKPLKETAFAAHKAVTTAEAAELAKILPGETYVKQAMATYQQEQRRLREIEEARLLKLAREREEEERLARAAELEKEAAALKAAGQAEEAATVQQEAEQVLVTQAYVPPPKMAAPVKTKNALKMIVDRDRLQTITDTLNSGAAKVPPNIPGVRFFQKWEFEVFSAASVPDTYRRPS
jgi:hypothetical protein